MYPSFTFWLVIALILALYFLGSVLSRWYGEARRLRERVRQIRGDAIDLHDINPRIRNLRREHALMAHRRACRRGSRTQRLGQARLKISRLSFFDHTDPDTDLPPNPRN